MAQIIMCGLDFIKGNSESGLSLEVKYDQRGNFGR